MSRRSHNPPPHPAPAGAAADPERPPAPGLDVLQRTLIPAREAAKLLNKSPATLADWRYKGLYLPFIKNGAAVLYDLTDIEEFLSHRKVTSAAAGRLLNAQARIGSRPASANRDERHADRRIKEEN